jgi:hypothetical protein
MGIIKLDDPSIHAETVNLTDRVGISQGDGLPKTAELAQIIALGGGGGGGGSIASTGVTVIPDSSGFRIQDTFDGQLIFEVVTDNEGIANGSATMCAHQVNIIPAGPTIGSVLNFSGWEIILGLPGGGGTPTIIYQDITYAALLALTLAGTLVVGRCYRYEYYAEYPLLGTAERVTSGAETLIAVATSVSTLASNVFSLNYPDDIIHCELVDSSPAARAYGRILYREDTVCNISAYDDWRHVLSRRWNTASDGTGSWTVMSDNGFPYQDMLMFGVEAPVVANIQNVSIGPHNKNNAYKYYNTVFLGTVKDVAIASGSYENTIGTGCVELSADADFYGNTIGSGMGGNKIGCGFISNIIGTGFISNNIGSYFSNNTIGDDFGANTTCVFFTQNTIGIQARDNFIGNDFNRNIVGDNFRTNSIFQVCTDNTFGETFGSNVVFGLLNTEIGYSCLYNKFMTRLLNGTIGNNVARCFVSRAYCDGLTIADSTVDRTYDDCPEDGKIYAKRNGLWEELVIS